MWSEKFTKKEGKQWILETSLLLNLLSCLNVGLAFSTPYWIISWPRVYSPFKRLGLWEACFAGLVLPTDIDQKAYHGCWWVLSPEFYNIRRYIMPIWFIFVQIFVTISFVIELLTVTFGLIVWLRSKDSQKNAISLKDGQVRNRNIPICPIQTTTFLTIISSILKTVTIFIFGIMYKMDRLWLPLPYLNYPSFSYGLFILSTFFSIFSSIGHVVYTIINRELLRAPPIKLQAVSMQYLPSSAKASGQYQAMEQTNNGASTTKIDMAEII